MRKSHKHQMHMVPVEVMTKEAIAFIREHEPPEGYFVGFSGGKDSIVTLELARMSGAKHTAYYSCTGIDPPEVVRFIRQHYSDVKWLRPKMSFWEGIYKKSPPLRMNRWCCDVLKKDPGRAIPLQNRIMGIRAEESMRRAARPKIDHFGKQLIYKPIFSWLAWHVWDFITIHGLAYPSLYDEGFDRIGCVVCPFIFHKNQRAYRIHVARWPKLFKTFEHACERWFAWRMKDGILSNQKHETFPEWMDGYYKGFE